MSGDWGYGTLFKLFIWGYLIGGLTLLPTALVLAWFLFTQKVENHGPEAPSAEDLTGQRGKSNESTIGRDEDASLGVGLDEEILRKLKRRTDVPDTFAGYFAVCREYVPGGVNGKPPDRTTAAGAIVSMESPSVYQSMYRSIFDRNKTTSPSIDAPNARSKKARNVFYVVLRLGHLMLYDNEDQLEVRHHISLAHYRTDVYAGGERIPEGELWIKRNCIRLVQKHDGETYDDAKSFYLFSDNCSEKEDFYHAMLQAQEHHEDDSTRHAHPVPLRFETPDLVKLVQQLHASEENMHTRWINALIGRVFLGLYKTAEIKNFIATKITKKIARVPKPALISSVALRSIDMGTLPPFLTNPKLKELTVDGDLVVEADVSYKGNFRIEIAAIARIELGTRFKAREVTLVLAAILKKLDGHILIRIKPPPSNRLWITFELPPRIEMSLEPIVSSRQITYGVILRAIESRIREVVNETLVLPNWDDMPFTDTLAQAVRGGIWQNDTQNKDEDARKAEEDDVVLEKATIDAEKLDEKADSASHIVRSLPLHSPMRSPLRSEKAHSTAALATTSDEDVSTPSQPESPPLPAFDGSHSRAKSKELTAEEIAAAAAAAAAASSAHPNKKTMFNQSLNTATAAARNWLVSKQNAQAARKTSHQRNTSSDTRPTTSEGQQTEGGPKAEAPTRPELQSSISKSHTEPMGRGHPLPPPGTPLPRPEKRQTWAIPAAASTFANIAKRKPVAHAPTHPSLAETRSTEHLQAPTPSSSSSHSHPNSPLSSDLVIDNQPSHDMPRRKPSNASYEEGRQVQSRRKSSAASSTSSIAPPPLPKRRQRQQSLNLSARDGRHSQILQGGEAEGGGGLFVVEAPVAEGSVPGTPVDEMPRGGNGSGTESLRSDSGSVNGDVEEGAVK
ncbi:hypothetical protein EK21DRAFT_63650 [Setomelanomma holmii]|uniref:SMP-LTD domain-containing protein n=1 Tax=Setomelanomma holmii TaxID=210430 RepID=A0A9P4LL89_9PLEO|nr:hypothetical protein EK21DRAFT_63650 [Setomelanomma holmii]